ncbi:MAG TPA: ABC transporter permease [Bacteroidales bacterium]|nr:ABC transporter permease [Bacteroidales bacterium]
MLRNYLLVTFRNLLKNRVFTIINIIGLGIALSVCIVAFFNNMFNYEFDRANENFNQIYRVNSFRDMQGREEEHGIVPATLGLEIKNNIPGIEKSARLMRSDSPVKVGENIFSTQVSYVDPEFLEIFTFHIFLGDKKSIENQGNVLVSRKMATTLFGKEYPIEKTISIVSDQNKEFTYTVGAVFADLPENSSFRIDLLTHFDNFLMMRKNNDADWKLMSTAFFIQVPAKASLPSITQSLKKDLPVQNIAREDFRINRFTLVPLKEVGTNTRKILSSGLFPSPPLPALIAPPFMALCILLIACFNFANTSRATFSKRLKEIGLRKTFGGQRKQLITQFMFETYIICFLAVLVSIVLAEFLVPAYSNLWAFMSIKITFSKYAFFWVFLILLMLLTGFISGVYPAIYVSSFSPITVLKGDSIINRSSKLSVALLSFQFIFSVMAIVMGIVFVMNAEYQKTLDLGYDRDKLIVVPIAPEYFTSFRNEVLSNPRIISAEGTQNHIGFGGYRRPIKDEEKQLEVDVLDVGPSYAQTMGLRLVAGRLFDESRSVADRTNGSIVVNQKLVKDFGWKEAVEQTITLYDTTKLTVIGVVEDFYTNGLWKKIEPAMLRLSPNDQYGVLAVRANQGDLPDVLSYLDLEWKKRTNNYYFTGILQEDTMQEEKDINGSIMKGNIFLAIVATLLSLIGIYNIVSLDLIRRTKEIGIRKIHGAPVSLIMFLVSKKFLIVLIVSSIVGCAGGYYMSLMLLDSIWDYFVELKFGTLVFAASIMFTTAILTIIFKIAWTAMKNPAVSLRYE